MKFRPAHALMAATILGGATLMAFTADAKWLVMGASWPIDRDAREVRRERLDGATVQQRRTQMPCLDHAVMWKSLR